MHSVSRLLFAWLLLAGMVSLLASAARAIDTSARQAEATTRDQDKKPPLFRSDDTTASGGEASHEPKPAHGTKTNDFGALIPTSAEQERTGRFFASEQTWRESALAEARPIRGPPGELRA